MGGGEILGALQETPAGLLQNRFPAIAYQCSGLLGAHLVQGLIRSSASTGARYAISMACRTGARSCHNFPILSIPPFLFARKRPGQAALIGRRQRWPDRRPSPPTGRPTRAGHRYVLKPRAATDFWWRLRSIAYGLLSRRRDRARPRARRSG